MRRTQDLDERFNPRGYPPLDIPGLDGQFCEACGEGFWSLKSERRTTRNKQHAFRPLLILEPLKRIQPSILLHLGSPYCLRFDAGSGSCGPLTG